MGRCVQLTVTDLEMGEVEFVPGLPVGNCAQSSGCLAEGCNQVITADRCFDLCEKNGVCLGH